MVCLSKFRGLRSATMRVEVKTIDMFRISGGKIVKHWGHADYPTVFLRQPRCS